jgi:hypothetical protein
VTPPYPDKGPILNSLICQELIRSSEQIDKRRFHFNGRT